MAKRDVIDVLIAEAIGEGEEGLAAVAWTILNRAAETGRTPAQVIADPGDYTGASNPGSATKRAMKDPKVRAKVERVWSQVQSGSIPDPTGGATHYWAPKGMKGGKAPYWADEEQSAAGRLKIGNHVFLPKQTPNSALAAINAVAPTPMPSRPVALGYSQNTGLPPVPAPRSYAPPGLKALTESNAAFGVLPFDNKPDPSTFAPGMGIDLNARDLNPPIVPRVPAPRGVGTSSLAPATKVQTIRMGADNQPITSMGPLGVQLAQEAADKEAARLRQLRTAAPVLPSDRVVPAAVPKLMQQAKEAAAANKSPQTAAAPPVAPVPRTKPNFQAAVAPTGIYAAAPLPVPAPLPTDPRLPKGDPALENFTRGQDIAMALYPKPSNSAVSAINNATLPRLPMMPSPAMSAARLPTVPVRTAPVAPARTPLPQTRTVNPVTQIVPAVQARSGQGLLGRIFNMATTGVVPQANTTQRSAPVPQNYLTPIPGQTGVEINGVDLAFMPTSVQQSSRWRNGY